MVQGDEEVVGEDLEGEPGGLDGIQVGDLVEAVPAEALVVEGHLALVHHDVRLEVLLVLHLSKTNTRKHGRGVR